MAPQRVILDIFMSNCSRIEATCMVKINRYVFTPSSICRRTRIVGIEFIDRRGKK
jgi:hypothetical protein